MTVQHAADLYLGKRAFFKHRGGKVRGGGGGGGGVVSGRVKNVYIERERDGNYFF